METKDKPVFDYEKIKDEINTSSVLMRIFAYKTSKEFIAMKVQNQENAMNFQIEKINPKFGEKSKNYSKMQEEFTNSIQDYEMALQQLCANYDSRIEGLILKKVDLETNLLLNIMQADELKKKNSKKQVSKKVKKIIKKIIKDDKKEEEPEQEIYKQIRKKALSLERDIKKTKNEIDDLNSEKEQKVLDAMEQGDKAITTEIKKVRSLGKLTRFFANRFNTYKMIMTKVINPLNIKIEEFRDENLNQLSYTTAELDINILKTEISNIQHNILDTKEENKVYEDLEK